MNENEGEVLRSRLTQTEQRISDIDTRGSRGLGEVAVRVTRLEEHVNNNSQRLNEITPLATHVATLSERMKGVQTDVGDIRTQMERREDGNRQVRLGLIGVTGTVLVGTITVVVTILTHGIH